MPKSSECKENVSEKFSLTFNCNGSNVGNGTGIGNGNFNGDGSSSSSCSGESSSGPCFLPCQKFYLVQSFNKAIITEIGEQLVVTFNITNTSGNDVSGPIVISSSIFGSIFVSDNIIAAGETIILVKNYIIQEKDVSSLILSVVSFVAKGVSTGVPGRYNSADRYSDVSVDKLPCVLASSQ